MECSVKRYNSYKNKNLGINFLMVGLILEDKEVHMRQELDMETLSKSLLDEIGEKVNSPETLQEYMHCIRKICNYFTSKGFGTYEATVMDSFITDISTYGGFNGKVFCKGWTILPLRPQQSMQKRQWR